MNKRQAKKQERKKDLLYDTGQKSYRQVRQFYRWIYNEKIRLQHTPIPDCLQGQPNYWGEW